MKQHWKQSRVEQLWVFEISGATTCLIGCLYCTDRRKKSPSTRTTLNKRTAIQRERVYIMGDAIGTTKEREKTEERREKTHI